MWHYSFLLFVGRPIKGEQDGFVWACDNATIRFFIDR